MSVQTAAKAARPDLECSAALLPSRHIQPCTHNVVPRLPRQNECSTRATSVISSPCKVKANPCRPATHVKRATYVVVAAAISANMSTVTPLLQPVE